MVCFHVKFFSLHFRIQQCKKLYLRNPVDKTLFLGHISKSKMCLYDGKKVLFSQGDCVSDSCLVEEAMHPSPDWERIPKGRQGHISPQRDPSWGGATKSGGELDVALAIIRRHQLHKQAIKEPASAILLTSAEDLTVKTLTGRFCWRNLTFELNEMGTIFNKNISF